MSDGPSMPAGYDLPATAPRKLGPAQPWMVTRFGPTTSTAEAASRLLPYRGGTVPPTSWLGHHFSSKIHIVRLFRLAASRQIPRSRNQPSPSQSRWGRDSAVNVPLPPSATLPT